MELRRIVGTLRRWYWLVLLAGGLAAISSIIYQVRQPQYYVATSTILVGRAISNPNPSSYEFDLGRQLAQTYGEYARRRPVQEAVVAALGLVQLPYYVVVQVPNTQLLEIRVTDTEPPRAQAVANELARQLVALSPSSENQLSQERRSFIEGQVKDLEDSIEQTKTQIDDLRERLKDTFSAREIRSTQEQIAALESKLRDYQSNYSSLIVLLQGGVNSLQVAEWATLPVWPEDNRGARTILVITALGLLLGAGAAFLLDYLEDVLRDPEDVKSALDLPVLGAVSDLPGDEERDRLITAQEADSADAEAYRLLYTNLEFAGDVRSLLVTSANPLEGKTTTAANLGAIIAQEGKRVVLVDADLRHPTLHHCFDLPNNEGLSNVLAARNKPATSLLQTTNSDGVRLLTAGTNTTNPSILLRSDRMAQILQELSNDADMVIVDSAPLLVATDAMTLASKVEGMLLVVHAGVTQRRAAMEALRMVRSANSNILGVMLNRVHLAATTFRRYDEYYGKNREASHGKVFPKRSAKQRRSLLGFGSGHKPDVRGTQ